MAERRPVAWGPLIGAMVVGAALAGVAGWRFNLLAMEERIKEKRTALKKLALSGRIPPNEDVMAYLTDRQAAVEARYRHWLALVTSPPLAEAATADPQLYFQEQFHEVQRTLERLAAARSVAVPEQLGFPKELPPSDTVPRLLVQLTLIREAATLIFEQGVNTVSSFKIEDPQPVASEEDEAAFLMRLPVRVRLGATLPQLMKVLGALQRATPLIDVQAIRVGLPSSSAPSEGPPPPTETERGPTAQMNTAGKVTDTLDVELVLSRYLVMETRDPSTRASIAEGVGRRPLLGVVPSERSESRDD